MYFTLKMNQVGGAIYLIEPDTAVRVSLRFALETDGFIIHEFADAASLLAKHDFGSCSCLALADKLTDMSGLELLRRLRERGIMVPAVLLANVPEQALIERAGLLKIRIVEKPFLGDHLRNAIRAAISQRW